MDANHSNNNNLNKQQLPLLSSQFNQQHQQQHPQQQHQHPQHQHLQQPQPQQPHHPQESSYTTFFSDNADGIVENVTNFEATPSFHNYNNESYQYIQDSGLSSSHNQRVDNLTSAAMLRENEYIYQQYLQMMNNSNLQPLDLNLHTFIPQQPQQLPPPQVAPPRQEQDVFNELLSMASNRNNQNGSWQNSQFDSSSSPSSFINNSEASMAITRQQQQQEEASYYDGLLLTSNNVDLTPLIQQNITKNSITMLQEFAHPSTNNYREYKLDIVQQPSRARMCGFGDKDRRPISPPPILKLTVLTKNGQKINPETFDISFLVIMCDACQQSISTDGNSSTSSLQTSIPASESKAPETFSTQIVSFPNNVTEEPGKDQYTAVKMRNLVGASVASATKLYDLDGNLNIFFIFQDISLRTEGVFRLRFSLIDIGSPHSHRVNTTAVSSVLAVAETDPFMVYTAKKYPGVVHSTPLSKCFARQGIKIPIRKEKVSNASAKKNARKSSLATADLSEDDTDEDDS